MFWHHDGGKWTNDLCEADSDRAIHAYTEILRVRLRAAIKTLAVIDTSPLVTQSTHGAAHKDPGCKRWGSAAEKKGKRRSFVSRAALTDWRGSTATSHQHEHESDGGEVGEGQGGEDFWKTLSHSLEWWHGSNETEERDTVL